MEPTTFLVALFLVCAPEGGNCGMVPIAARDLEHCKWLLARAPKYAFACPVLQDTQFNRDFFFNRTRTRLAQVLEVEIEAGGDR
jgi:hypothetical protein